jgi:hypothetical protein
MPSWRNQLAWDPDVILYVDFTTRRSEVTEYSVVLAIRHEGRLQTVRVYDAAHGFNELHRHTLTGGKQPGEAFHPGTLAEGMRAAIGEIRRGYEEMIESWRR